MDVEVGKKVVGEDLGKWQNIPGQAGKIPPATPGKCLTFSQLPTCEGC